MRTTIIAEAGVNHNGSLSQAKKLIDVASSAGVDLVKFQSFRAKNLVRKNTPKADYQLQTTDIKESQYQMLKKLELSKSNYRKLLEYSKLKKIDIFSTAFDIDDVKTLKDLGQNIFKIPSGEITNLPYLRYIGSLNKTIILSTGMSNLEEIKNAIEVLEQSGTSKRKITVLHCTSSYPAPYKEVNLLAMKEIEEKLAVRIGYSDHTLGVQVAIAAVTLGATVIEKHFTLDKKLPGPDHKASLNPIELHELVSSIRIIEDSLGKKIKEPSYSELKNIKLIRKSIVARKNIKKGEKFSSENLTTKRPGTGLSPMKWDYILGRTATKDYEIDDFISI